jgi:hypothetical protein
VLIKPGLEVFEQRQAFFLASVQSLGIARLLNGTVASPDASR